jgi:hypothetical protein
MWSVGYVVFAMLCGWNAVKHVRNTATEVAA